MFIWKNLLFLYQFTFALVLREPPNGKEAVETKEELPSTVSDVHGFRSWKVQLNYGTLKQMEELVNTSEVDA